MFQKLLIAVAIALPIAAFAAEEKKPTPQQQKMAACNQEANAKNLKGDDRKAFMSKCLSTAKQTQQEKMTACNKEATAKNLKGDDRKAFMSKCLSAAG